MMQTHQLRTSPQCRTYQRSVAKRPIRIVCSAASAQRTQPAWTGDGILSKLVNFLVFTPPMSNWAKAAARHIMISSAQKAGVDWPGHVRKLEATQEVYRIKAELENPDIQYPSYYLQPFHAYEEGNLSWKAAFEVEPVSYIMALRTFKDAPSAGFAMDKLRLAINDSIKSYHDQNQLNEVKNILDIGCSVGISTRFMAQLYPEANTVGLDLSAYFLAVAEYSEREHFRNNAEPGRQRIQYMHGLAESSGLPDGSQDIVTFQFVLHECREAPIRAIIKEARRLLKPGGMVVMTDNNPKSKTIQNLPPYLFAAMKSTEPWSDEYYSVDMEAVMREVGFKDVVTVETDHRHRAVMGHL